MSKTREERKLEGEEYGVAGFMRKDKGGEGEDRAVNREGKREVKVEGTGLISANPG